MTLPDENLRMQLAKAVAKDARGVTITPENERGRWASIEEHIHAHACFCVEVAEHILGIDCDKPAALADVNSLVEQLANAGVQPVLLASGRKRRCHIFAS